MDNKEAISTFLKKNPQGCTIEEISSSVKLNRMTVSTYLRELKAADLISVRVAGQTKIHYWVHKRKENV